MSSNTFPVANECDVLSGTIDVTVPIAWTGSLNSAVLSGEFHANLVGFGPPGGPLVADAIVDVNGIEVFRVEVTSGIGGFVSSGQISVDVKNWLLQGNNLFTFNFSPAFGVVSSAQICANTSLTVDATGTVTPPPPPPGPVNPVQTAQAFVIIIVVVIVAAVAAGLFLRARG